MGKDIVIPTMVLVDKKKIHTFLSLETTLWSLAFHPQIKSATFYKSAPPPEKLCQVPLNVISIPVVSLPLQNKQTNKNSFWFTLNKEDLQATQTALGYA